MQNTSIYLSCWLVWFYFLCVYIGMFFVFIDWNVFHKVMSCIDLDAFHLYALYIALFYYVILACMNLYPLFHDVTFGMNFILFIGMLCHARCYICFCTHFILFTGMLCHFMYNWYDPHFMMLHLVWMSFCLLVCFVILDVTFVFVCIIGMVLISCYMELYVFVIWWVLSCSLTGIWCVLIIWPDF